MKTFANTANNTTYRYQYIAPVDFPFVHFHQSDLTFQDVMILIVNDSIMFQCWYETGASSW